jgi:hypothetical protein
MVEKRPGLHQKFCFPQIFPISLSKTMKFLPEKKKKKKNSGWSSEALGIAEWLNNDWPLSCKKTKDQG